MGDKSKQDIDVNLNEPAENEEQPTEQLAEDGDEEEADEDDD